MTTALVPVPVIAMKLSSKIREVGMRRGTVINKSIIVSNFFHPSATIHHRGTVVLQEFPGGQV